MKYQKRYKKYQPGWFIYRKKFILSDNFMHIDLIHVCGHKDSCFYTSYDEINCFYCKEKVPDSLIYFWLVSSKILEVEPFTYMINHNNFYDTRETFRVK